MVALASRYPIVETFAVKPSSELAQALGLSADFSFSRQVLRATVDVPHLGYCDCYVVHFKSKRSMIALDEHSKNWSAEQTISESLKAEVAGGWGSTVQRGSEAALLMVEMITRRELSNQPMLLMGDFNNTLADGVLSHLLTNNLRFISSIDRDAYLAKYCLNDAWNLFTDALINEAQEADSVNVERKSPTDNTDEINILIQTKKAKNINQANNLGRNPTHYFGASNSVLDYILLSCEFDASYHDSMYQVSDYHTYDRHLINPLFERDGESTDHGVVLVTLTLRS